LPGHLPQFGICPGHPYLFQKVQPEAGRNLLGKRQQVVRRLLVGGRIGIFVDKVKQGVAFEGAVPQPFCALA
jgi:hypothetical protein